MSDDNLGGHTEQAGGQDLKQLESDDPEEHAKEEEEHKKMVEKGISTSEK